MKTITTLLSTSAIALVTWTGYIATHPNFKSIEIVPEWNGPDYKVTYHCEGGYKKLDGLHMVDNGDTVTVNYGAFGRRYQEFKCGAPMYSEGAASR